jgi:1,4-dihydroxy-2-naphthoyl-CoA hydrolase
MNGGVSLVLLETIGSISSALHVDMQKFNAFGMQASANHTSVAKAGDIITARSKVVHIGRTTHVWDVEITNQLGKLISVGRITMMITERRPSP